MIGTDVNVNMRREESYPPHFATILSGARAGKSCAKPWMACSNREDAGSGHA
eukprot:COSAG01_NODE_60679_length_293_cov_1.056701_1_plen_51_part_10